MSIKYLGEHFDIHCGGVDNIFPHHENELAQSVSATNKPFVNYWMHSEHLQLKGGKMSKTEGNFYTISDLKSKGYSPEEIRFVMLSAHYRTKLSFSIEQCLEARPAIQRIASLYNRLINIANGNLDKYNLPIEFQDFIKALDNDLDTPKALAIFFKWIRSINKKIDNNQAMNNKDINGSIQFLKIVDNIFGLLIKEDSPPDEIYSIAEEREVYRKAGDWEKADQLRDKIYSLGWVIEDKADGLSIKQKK